MPEPLPIILTRHAVERARERLRLTEPQLQRLMRTIHQRGARREFMGKELMQYFDRSLRGRVAGKVVLVTGGSSGIGLATVHRLAEAGAVTLTCGRDQGKLDAARAQLQARGFDLATYQADLSDLDDCERLLQTLLAK